MHRRVSAVTAAVFLLATVAGTAPITIEVRGERVSIHAEKVPLVQVLNGVAWEAKMKIVYDAPPPQDVVNVDINGLSMSDAITTLLTGHGLVYVARMDATGTRVDTLVLTSGGPGTVKMPPQGGIPEAPPPAESVPDVPPPENYEQPQEQPTYVATPYTPPTPTPAASGWNPGPVILPGMGEATPAPTTPVMNGGMGMTMMRSSHGPPGGYYPPPPPPPPEPEDENPPAVRDGQ